MSLLVLELFSGLGGCSAALARLGVDHRVAAAYDVSPHARAAYALNFPGHPVVDRNLETVAAAELAAHAADLWWLSPPCQPYTGKGLGRDLDDPRAASLAALIDRLAAVRPPFVALENVPGFARSRARRRLLDALESGGYEVRERLLCPGELGRPNLRLRYYLLASRHGFAGAGTAPGQALDDFGQAPAAVADRRAPERRAPRPLAVRLADLLDPDPDPDLAAPPGLLARYAGALDLVDAGDPAAVAACFASSYGRSPARSGSYLVTARGPGGEPAAVRRFSPAEILRLLDFPAGYRLPPGLPRAIGWRLAGNSVSVAAVAAVLAVFPWIRGPVPLPPDRLTSEGPSPSPPRSSRCRPCRPDPGSGGSASPPSSSTTLRCCSSACRRPGSSSFCTSWNAWLAVPGLALRRRQ